MKRIPALPLVSVGVAATLALAGLTRSALRCSRSEVPSGRGSERVIEPLDRSARVRLDQNYGELPLSFEPNLGQLDERVSFVARGRGGNAFLTSPGAVFTLPAAPRPAQRAAITLRRTPSSSA